MEFKAINNTVVIEIIKESTKQEKTESGIIFMKTQSNGLDVNTIHAKVVSVGEGRYHEKTGQLIPIPLVVGDIVVVNGAVGGKLNEQYRVVGVDDIFAKIV